MNWRRLFSYKGEIGRKLYFGLGLALALLKMAVDNLAVYAFANLRWTYFDYLGPISPESHAARQLALYQYLIMGAISLPFLWVGTALTVQRLRATGAPLWLVVLFFIPGLNLAFFLLLSVIPHGFLQSRPKEAQPPPHSSVVLVSWALLSGAGSVLFAATLAWVFVQLGTQALAFYGWTLFLALPFVTGLVSATLYSMALPASRSTCAKVGMLSVLVGAVFLLAFLVEGLWCLIMAAPLAIPTAALGGMMAYGMNPRGPRRKIVMCVSPVLLLLCAMPLEKGTRVKGEPLQVSTRMHIRAAPEAVWRHVVSFSRLPEPDEPIFRTGIAYPVAAKIEGSGVGAVRQCEFSTGAFVEPITVWNEPELLAFNVTSCPPPMREMNPFGSAHPPHLSGFMVSEKGQFRLIRMEDGGTLLVGTTWYRHNLQPTGYWRLWSDWIVSSIHARVLRHIKRLSEAPQ